MCILSPVCPQNTIFGLALGAVVGGVTEVVVVAAIVVVVAAVAVVDAASVGDFGAVVAVDVDLVVVDAAA